MRTVALKKEQKMMKKKTEDQMNCVSKSTLPGDQQFRKQVLKYIVLHFLPSRSVLGNQIR